MGTPAPVAEPLFWKSICTSGYVFTSVVLGSFAVTFQLWYEQAVIVCGPASLFHASCRRK
jgi:hypothetical protein